MKNFDAWARELSDELRKKEQKVEIKPEDLYTHKDVMRGEYITVDDTETGYYVTKEPDTYSAKQPYSETIKLLYPPGARVEVHPCSGDYLKHYMKNCGIVLENVDVENRPGLFKVVQHFKVEGEVYE